MKSIFTFFLTAILACTSPAFSQITDTDTAGGDDLMAMLNEPGEGSSKGDYTLATFKGTRIVNGHTIEMVGPGNMDFRILHRFGRVNQGVKDLFGLDNATVRFGFDFGITPWLNLGIGRSTVDKEYDGFAKLRLLRQRDGGPPFTLSYVGSLMIKTADPGLQLADTQEYYFSNRVTYSNQLLIARKFNDWLSLQLMPSHLHYNLVPTTNDPNDVFALGIGGRLKINRRMAITGEWYPVIGERITGSRNALSLGLDIETGGHVFQVHFTNVTGMTERNFIGQTTGNWADGDIRLGFNISRVFQIVKPRGFEGTRNKIY